LSNETGNDQPTEIYDFLYRDSDRIASYYAQIWNGRLLSVEESSTESQRPEESTKANAQLLSVESKTLSDYQLQNKRSIDMHDAATVDLLLRLAAQKAERGVFGSIRSFSETCFFLDRNILKFAGPMIDLVAQQAEDANRPTMNRQQRREQERKARLKCRTRPQR
jgi:hypothetical protein